MGALPTTVIDELRAVGVQVTPVVVPEIEPPLRAWTVVIATPTGEWRESFGSEGELQSFLRGVQAGAAALGCFDVQVNQ